MAVTLHKWTLLLKSGPNFLGKYLILVMSKTVDHTRFCIGLEFLNQHMGWLSALEDLTTHIKRHGVVWSVCLCVEGSLPIRVFTEKQISHLTAHF